MLLAEDLLLLLLDDESGHFRDWRDKFIDIGLASAIMAELVISGAVEISEPRNFLTSSKVRVKDASAPIEPILKDALHLIAEKERPTSKAISKLRKGLRMRLLSRLVERGLVRRESERYAVVRTRSTWPAVDASHKKTLRTAINQALFSEGELSEREAVLVRLLAETDQIRSVFPAGKAEQPYLQRVHLNLELMKHAQAITHRTWTHPSLERVFRACHALVPKAD